MIPESLLNGRMEITENEPTTKTYRLSSDKIQGFAESLQALQQAIYKVLNTERYEYPIYSYDYGIELDSLVGKDPEYVRIELKRRIRECLLRDERIQGVENFVLAVTGDEMLCTFSVVSIYGDLTISQEVAF